MQIPHHRPRKKVITRREPSARSASVKERPLANMAWKGGSRLPGCAGPLYSGSFIMNTRKYHCKPAKAVTKTRAATLATLRREAAESKRNTAPTVARMGEYQGTKTSFRPNWMTTRTSPRRQAPIPAQKITRPRERSIEGDVVETLGALVDMGFLLS